MKGQTTANKTICHTAERYPCTETLTDALVAMEYIITPQRRRVIDQLAKVKVVDDLDAFWLSLYEEHKISMATIYTTLGLLCKTQLVRKVDLGYTKGAYMLLTKNSL